MRRRASPDSDDYLLPRRLHYLTTPTARWVDEWPGRRKGIARQAPA